MLSTLLSALLAALTLPTVLGSTRLPDLEILSWVSLVPFIFSLQKVSRLRGAFKLGLLFGVVYYGVSLYWIFIAMRHYGDVPLWGSLLGLGLAVMIEALFIGGVAVITVWGSRRGIAIWIVLPLAWVAQDFARGYFPFGGFSWASLAYTQRSFLTLLQTLDLTGIYGVSYLLLLSNTVVCEVIGCLRRRQKIPTVPLITLFLMFGASLIYGKIRIEEVRQDLKSRETLRVSLVQGNIPQEEKWLAEKVEEIIARYIVLSEQTDPDHPALILWPEAAYPAVMPPDIVQVGLLSRLKVPLLMGVVTYEGQIPGTWPPLPDDKVFALHNSAVFIAPGGVIAGKYHKNHLVPMGEYVPLGRLLFFLNKIVPAVSSFSPGEELNLMNLNVGAPLGAPPSMAQQAAPLRFGTTICYEDLFPEISRTFVRKGADFLVNLTNDAWYEHSSAVFQHVDFSRYRAIENRRTMIRATNTGVTGFFSPLGETIATAPVFKEAVLTADIPLGGAKSFYTRFGNLFAWGCVVMLSLLLGRGVVQRRKYG